MTLKLSDYMANEILPEGLHTMTIDTFRIVRANSSNNQYLELTLKTPSKNPIRIVERFHFTTDKAIKRSLTCMHRIFGHDEFDIKVTKGKLGVGLTLGHDDVLFDLIDDFRKIEAAGHKLKVDIKQTEWEDRTQCETDGYLPFDWELTDEPTEEPAF